MSKKEQRIANVMKAHTDTAVHGFTLASTVMQAYRLLTDLGVSQQEILDAVPEHKKLIEQQLEPDAIEFPADVLAHWASGPVEVCYRHLKGLQALGGALGASVPSTPLTEPAECINCINEAKNE